MYIINSDQYSALCHWIQEESMWKDKCRWEADEKEGVFALMSFNGVFLAMSVDAREHIGQPLRTTYYGKGDAIRAMMDAAMAEIEAEMAEIEAGGVD